MKPAKIHQKSVVPFTQVLDSTLDNKEEKALLTSGHYAAAVKVQPIARAKLSLGRLFLVDPKSS